jgi:hypothetical protein
MSDKGMLYPGSHIDQNGFRIFIHELPGFGRPQVLDF